MFRRHGKEFFFAYLSDFGQSDMEWEGTSFTPRARTPAFEIIFVYTQSEGSLDIYAPRNTKYVTDLQQKFTDTILKLDKLDEFAADDMIYNLDLLADRNFVFQYSVDSGIESVKIHRLRLNLLGSGKRRVKVEADPSNDPRAVYDLIERLNLPPFYVTQAEINVTFYTPIPGTRSRKRKFQISYPDWCNLRHQGRDQIIREMLTNSGIELMKRETAEEDSGA